MIPIHPITSHFAVFRPVTAFKEAHAVRAQHGQAVLLREVRGVLQSEDGVRGARRAGPPGGSAGRSTVRALGDTSHPPCCQDDLQPEPVAKTGGELNSMQDIQIVEVVPSEEWGAMPLQKMRTLLALLLKKISTPGGFVNSLS